MAISDAEIGNPNVRKFLDFISKAEGTDKYGYHTQVGNTQIAQLDQHPKQSTVTTADGSSNAAGRYQFIGSTWDEQSRKHGLTDFGAVNQDKAAVGLIKDNGAYEDVAKGDFGVAINKLGGVWASFPSSKYKQPKKSWDWASAQLGINGAPPAEPGRDYNDSVFQKGGATPSERVRTELQKDMLPPTPLSNFGTGFMTSLKNDNTATNWYAAQVGDFIERPDFRWTPELSKKYTEGLNEKNWAFVVDNATSEFHAEKLRQRALEFQQTEAKYEEAGIGAGAGRLIGGVLDPTNLGLIALTAYAPTLGVPVAASRAARIAYGVAEGAVTNAAVEALTYKNRPGGDLTDVAFAGLMGVALGGVGGEIGHRVATGIARREAGTIFDNDLRNIQAWSLERLHDTSAEDYAKMRMFAETDQLKGFTPEQLKFREAELTHEYTMLVEERKRNEIFGTGDFVPPKNTEPPKVGEPPKAGDAPPAKETKQTWTDEWNTPSIHKDSNGSDVLQLPPKQSLEALIAYTQKFSPNKAMVAWMDKMLEGIDLSKVKFFEIGSGKRPQWYVNGSKLGSSHAAHIVTPWNSLGTLGGDNAYFVSRGQYRGVDPKTGKRVNVTPTPGDRRALQTGLTDSTFIHELSHVAAVYKQRLFHRNKDGSISQASKNIVGDEKTYQAVKGIDDLYKYVQKITGKQTSKQHYGMTNAYEFLAEGLSNPTFQKFLKDIELPNSIQRTNILSDFLDKVMDLLGIDKKGQTAFHKFLELADDLTDPGGISRNAEVSGAPKGGYRISPDGKADDDTVLAAQTANIPETFAIGLGLENRLGKKSLPDKVRSLAQALFPSTTGYKDNSVVKISAWDDKLVFSGGWNAQLRKVTHIAFIDWFKESGYAFHQRGEAFEKFGTDVWEYVHGWEGDYDPRVIKAGEAVRKNMAERVKDINNPMRSVGGVKLGLTETEVTLLDGTKVKTGTLEENPNYLPRVHDSNKRSEMISKYGLDKVEQWWASAYKSGRDALEVSDEDAKRFAKWYLKTLDKASNQAANQHMTDMLRGQDRPALIESLMDRQVLALNEAEANKLADQILGQRRDASGQLVANLKHRNTIDERFVGTVGSDIEGISLKDFVKTNALEITESYNNRVAGTVSLAKNLDIYSPTDINKAIGEAVTRVSGDGYREVDLQAAAKDLQFAFDRILSIPQEEGFSPLRKGLEMVRNFNVIRLMSGSVYNQMAETAQMTGTVGYKALMQAIPELESMQRDFKTGKAPSDLLDHLENAFGGAGAEYLSRMDFGERTGWRDHYGKGSWQAKLDKVDEGISRFAGGVLDYTGMTPWMIQQKRLHATALVNGFVDLANGIDNGGAAFLTKERLAFLGLSENDFSKLKGVLKNLTSEGEGTITTTSKKIDWDRFVAEEPEMHHKFMVAIMRESRRVIQENDLGSMVPFMGGTLGKTVFQFMNFGMNAWNKQLVFSLNHADTATASTMLQGILYGSLIYSARQYQQSMGMNEEDRTAFLEDRLDPVKIVANGWSRTGAASLLPNAISAFVPGGASLFAGGRTTTDLSGLMSNPTLALGNSVLTLAKKGVTNPIDSEKQFNKADANAFFKIMPLNNLIGVNTLINQFTSDLPVSSKEE